MDTDLGPRGNLFDSTVHNLHKIVVLNSFQKWSPLVITNILRKIS